jgi:glycosyltransferase involved in cell wall biosynthesis
MRDILLLSFAFPPDNEASAARSGQLFHYLPEHGYQPLVIASTVFGSQREGPFVRRVPLGKTAATVAALSGIGRAFTRYCAPYEDRLSWVPHAAAAAARLIRSQSVDAIYSTSPPLAVHFAALWLSTKFRLPWIADFQDPVREVRRRKWIYPYDAIIERMLFRRADRVAANTDTVAAAWCARYPHWSSKISVLWNCFDPREEIGPAPLPTRPFRVLAHVGDLYGGRHPCRLLASLERLGIDASAVRVKLVGRIDEDVWTEHGPQLERIRASGLLEFGNTRVSREEAAREAAEADCLILLDLNERPTAYQVPSKLVSYLRIGRPILAYTPRGSPVERILARSDIRYVAIDPSTPEALDDQKVRDFLSFPVEPRQASAWFRKTFDARRQGRVVAALLDELLEKSSAAIASIHPRI